MTRRRARLPGRTTRTTRATCTTRARRTHRIIPIIRLEPRAGARWHVVE